MFIKIYFLFMLSAFKLLDAFQVCPSVTIQGPIAKNLDTTKQESSIENCEIILGNIRILNAQFDTTISFKNLIEVTDYIIIFQPINLSTLKQLFPKLAIIRGDRLFKNYALTIFFSSTLINLNFNNLIAIQRGSIFISRLIHTCYINTIDWSYIIKDDSSGNKNLALITSTNNDCHFERCPKSCKQTIGSADNEAKFRCWSEHDCQIICPNECANNCNINTGECCDNKNCMHCYNSTKCVLCSKLRNLQNGECVDKCPVNTLLYETHSCIKYLDCTLNSIYLTRNYYIYENSTCVRECPNGYRYEINEFFHDNKIYRFKQCIKCDDFVCKKDCLFEFKVKTLSDLESIRNCVRIKQLIIDLNTKISYQLLEDSFKYLEEIDNYLLVVNNNYLTTLKFFQNLRIIHGLVLYDQKYALLLHKNDLLRNLWDYKTNKFTITNGGIKFFENPEFCLNDINEFVKYLNKSSLDMDISAQFNGYKRLTCSNSKLELNITIGPNNYINVTWPVIFSDTRRLKGFVLSYIEAPGNLTYDPNDISTVSSGYSAVNNLNDWLTVYIQHNEMQARLDKYIISEIITVKPYTRYAIYVKADITFASQFDNRSMHTSFENDRVISDIYYVYSLPAKPSSIDELRYESLTHDSINLRWKPPKEPNGVITFYFVAYSSLKDQETLPSDIDVCQFEPDKSRMQYNGVSPSINDYDDEDSCNNLINKKKHTENQNNAIKKKISKISDEDKNTIISVEDDIYNMAFRPSIGFMKLKNQTINDSNVSYSRKKPATNKPDFEIKPASTDSNNDVNPEIKLKTASIESFKFSNVSNNYSLIMTYYNDSVNLIRFIQSNFLQLTDEQISYFYVSNATLNGTLKNLKNFVRYFITVTSCQNYTNELINYSNEYLNKNKNYFNLSLYSNYIQYFSLASYCSNPNLIIVRTLANESMNTVNSTQLITESDAVYFKWSKPAESNGIIYKYNVKLVDVLTNKTQGPLCHATLNNLKIALNHFLLIEGHNYYIQVQAVSTAGYSPWSNPIIYYAPHTRNRYNEIIGGVVAAVVIIVIVAFITVYLVYNRYLKSKDKGYFTLNAHYYDWKPDEWEIPRDNVQIYERIGSGCFGEVFRGRVTFKTGETLDCAVKLHKPDKPSKEKIVIEASMMKRITAPHIIKFLGVVSIGDPVYLVLEYMDKGDLRNYLHKHRPHQELCDDILTTERLYKMAAEIADGMLWLSEHKYVHCDLAARNCLVAKNDIIKIADLGLCKDIYVNPEYRKKCKALLPIRWMAVESLMEGIFTTKSDVWSYGVVIWELCTYADHPYSGKENDEVIKFVKNGGSLEIPPNSPPKFVILMEKCMKRKPFDRISFSCILDILEPDLTVEFKAKAYYNNEYKLKKQKLIEEMNKISNKIYLSNYNNHTIENENSGEDKLTELNNVSDATQSTTTLSTDITTTASIVASSAQIENNELSKELLATLMQQTINDTNKKSITFPEPFEMLPLIDEEERNNSAKCK